MSLRLINLSPDLRKLRDDGYEIEARSGYLIIHNVPYVNAEKQVKRGILVSELELAGDVTTRPKNHVAMFSGEHPCYRDGSKFVKIEHSSSPQSICDDFMVDHSFSSKPKDGYVDYYHKMTTYISMISRHAETIDPSVTARTRRVIETNDPDSVFEYVDTASSRAGIVALSRKLEIDKLAIVGLGGTGSYVLDLIAKTPAGEIHLFDGDNFSQHNAFRSPGAPSIDELKKEPKKVNYLTDRYRLMRKKIIPHDFYISAENVDELDDMDFVFLCVDRGDVKLPIIKRLEMANIPFIDVGMGLKLVDDRLHGIVRVTVSTAHQRNHIREKKRIGFSDGEADGEYSRNIQIADLNMLNAALAVIKWKKILGFYADLDHEYFSAYTIDGNHLTNEDKLEA